MNKFPEDSKFVRADDSVKRIIKELKQDLNSQLKALVITIKKMDKLLEETVFRY